MENRLTLPLARCNGESNSAKAHFEAQLNVGGVDRPGNWIIKLGARLDHEDSRIATASCSGFNAVERLEALAIEARRRYFVYGQHNIEEIDTNPKADSGFVQRSASAIEMARPDILVELSLTVGQGRTRERYWNTLTTCASLAVRTK